MIVPSVGRIVHFVLGAEFGRSSGQHRPAIIVRVWDEPATVRSCVQLQVFTDGNNDQIIGETEVKNVVWRTSVHQDTSGALSTYHAPERVEQPAQVGGAL